MATRKAPEPKDLTSLIVAGSILIAILATLLHAPGIAVVWLGVVVAGWMIPRPVFTGKKNAYGQATPAHPGEQAAQLRYRLWNDLRWRVIVPQTGWLPGWPVNLSWVHAVAIALAVTAIPQSVPYGAVINAVAAFILVAQVQWTRRQFSSQDDKNPGVPVSALGKLWSASVLGKVVLVAGALIGAGAGAAGYLSGYLSPIAALGAGVTIMIAIWLKPVSDVALVDWRALVKARAEWDYRWGQFNLKGVPPRLLSTKEVGSARVEEFDAQLSGGSKVFTVKDMSDTARTVLGANMKVAMVDVEDVDSQGQPKPGTIHASRFKVIQWPDDQFPDLNDPTLDVELATLAISSAAAWACDAVGYSRFNPATVQLITQAPAPDADEDDEDDDELDEPESKDEADEEFFAIWKTTWTNRTGLPIGEVRNRADIRGEMSDQFGTGVLVDNRGKPEHFMLIGAVYDDTNTIVPSSGITQKNIDELIEEDQWRTRWGAVLKQNVNAPRPSFPTKETRRLNGRQSHMSLTRLPFTTLQGEDPKQYFGLESQMAATLSAAPFVAINGFRQSKTDRSPGSRHPQAFNLTWSHDGVPTDLSNLVGPERRGQLDATEWVIAGRMNEAFRASRMPVPEVMKVEALTKSTSRKHIWKVKLRLYDGVTVQNVRTAVGKFLSVSGSPWARVSDDGEGCTVYIGAKPPVQGSSRADVVLENPKRDIPLLTALDWEQAWNVSGVRGSEGALPKLVLTSHLEHNDKVQVLDFSLPPGVEMSDVKAAVGKLKSATGNAFVDVRVSPDGASTVRLLVCEVNPMPERAGYDFDAIDTSAFLPFATGIDGEPIAYKPKVDPHILIAGASGGGKSVVLQSLIYSALIRGWDLYITDPTKSAADFQFAQPYAKSITVDIFEAAAMMRTVYEEVLRRKKLNAANGVGNYRDLPEDIRPPHIGIIIDEFTSLMGSDPVPKPSDDPEMEIEREAILAVNAAKQQIGVYTGKIAREARSTGATLFLATQKLSAKMLDGIPGAGDLKNLSLDTILPVPVSDRFPNGWARNDQLEIGDTLYTPSGDETTILAFSDVFTEPDVYEVTFDDGQVVTAGAEHLWTASSYESRKKWCRAKTEVTPQRLSRANVAETIAQSAATGTLASAGDLAEMLGYASGTRVHELASEFGMDRMVITDGAAIAVDRDARNVRGVVYEVTEFCSMLSAHLRRLAGVQSDGQLPPLERVVSTREMAEAVGREGRSNWAIRLSDAIDSADVDLPLDPYVLGVWLGDGCRGSGGITSSAGLSCTGEDGLTDQAHMLSTLEAAGFLPRVLPSSDKQIGTRGLMTVLRSMDVLYSKHIPAIYLRASKAQRLALLQGLMDTDGTLMASGQCSIGQNSKVIAEGIFELVRSLGIKAGWSEWDAAYTPEGQEKKVTGRVYHVSFKTSLPAFRLPRKLAKQRAPQVDGQASWRYVTSVTKVESVPTRCIAVDDPEHLFLVEGFIPTHNTNLSRMLLGKATFGEKQSALRAATEAPDLGDVVPPGRGLWETTEGAAMIMQSWYDPAEQKRLATELEERLTPLDESEKADISKYMPKPVSQPGVFDADDDDDVAPVVVAVDESDDVVLDDLELSLDDLEADPISLALAALNASDDVDDSDNGEELVWEETGETMPSVSNLAPDDALVWDDEDDSEVTADVADEATEVVVDEVDLDEPEAVEVPGDEVIDAAPETAPEVDVVADEAELEVVETPATRIVVATHESLVTPEPGTLYLWEGTVAAPAGSTSIVGTGAEGDTGWDVLDALMIELMLAGPDVSEVVWYDTGSLGLPDPDFGVPRREIVREVLDSVGVTLTIAKRPQAALVDAW